MLSHLWTDVVRVTHLWNSRLAPAGRSVAVAGRDRARRLRLGDPSQDPRGQLVSRSQLDDWPIGGEPRPRGRASDSGRPAEIGRWHPMGEPSRTVFETAKLIRVDVCRRIERLQPVPGPARPVLQHVVRDGRRPAIVVHRKQVEANGTGAYPDCAASDRWPAQLSPKPSRNRPERKRLRGAA